MAEVIRGVTDLPKTLHMHFPRLIDWQRPSIFNLLSQSYDSQITKFLGDHLIKSLLLLHCSCSNTRVGGINTRQHRFSLLQFCIESHPSGEWRMRTVLSAPRQILHAQHRHDSGCVTRIVYRFNRGFSRISPLVPQRPTRQDKARSVMVLVPPLEDQHAGKLYAHDIIVYLLHSPVHCFETSNDLIFRVNALLP